MLLRLSDQTVAPPPPFFPIKIKTHRVCRHNDLSFNYCQCQPLFLHLRLNSECTSIYTLEQTCSSLFVRQLISILLSLFYLDDVKHTLPIFLQVFIFFKQAQKIDKKYNITATACRLKQVEHRKKHTLFNVIFVLYAYMSML